MSSLGPLQGKTTNYGFNLVNFNWFSWHDYEYENWTLLDAILLAGLGVTNLKGIWQPNTEMEVGERWVDGEDSTTWDCLVAHISGSGTFAEDRAANPSYWAQTAFLLRDGSPASPALAFLKDTNTGLFRNDDNTLDVSLGGAYRASFNQGGLLLTSGSNVGLELYNAAATPGLRRARLVQHGNDEFRIQQMSDAGSFIQDDLRHPMGGGWSFGSASFVPPGDGHVGALKFFTSATAQHFATWNGITYTAPGSANMTAFNAIPGAIDGAEVYHVAYSNMTSTVSAMLPNLRFALDTTVITSSSYNWLRVWSDPTGHSVDNQNSDNIIPLYPAGGWRNDIALNIRLDIDSVRSNYRPFLATAWGWDASSRPTILQVYGICLVEADGLQLQLANGAWSSASKSHVTRGRT